MLHSVCFVVGSVAWVSVRDALGSFLPHSSIHSVVCYMYTRVYTLLHTQVDVLCVCITHIAHIALFHTQCSVLYVCNTYIAHIAGLHTPCTYSTPYTVWCAICVYYTSPYTCCTYSTSHLMLVAKNMKPLILQHRTLYRNVKPCTMFMLITRTVEQHCIMG